jgi:hypothetical protein
MDRFWRKLGFALVREVEDRRSSRFVVITVLLGVAATNIKFATVQTAILNSRLADGDRQPRVRGLLRWRAVILLFSATGPGRRRL